ncbi:MAG TPA: beta-ketoacyl synthase chain length factor [Thiobacillus sp.]|nr:MAG: 3-oxoacyl-ACP synthase [Hydrogenophilales bacterium 28-61-11]OYZ57569.1 MAG: 3-oxoacyl-ACP synthase [Hydrogenophilales bacterium 16-61-112]OZA50077.1 MAG: 3-oxoacyl-ACP synthase [Hydrogenophilales bacterium 17-61-76]HQT30275.1 beta-ketoacyl synthase chain length factor [Thiobacillus sp.]HQT69765.1 beta-ketoacyl synthase chain length factor [Thiobacillus sp.]
MRLLSYLDGIGLVGPGLDNWPAAHSILAGHAAYESRPLVVAAPAALPPAERRRTGLAIKVALAVAFDALAAAQLDARQLATVFTSSGADNDNCDAICKTLASDDRSISPTRFHNSVHNAPGGYWGIASGAMTPATVLCAHDASFGAGLLEAMTQLAVDGSPGSERGGTLLVAYDMPYPEPLHAKRPLPAAFGIALALMPARSAQSLARIELELSDAAPDTLSDPALETLRRSIPAARGLPLLQAVARGDACRVVLDYLAPLSLLVQVGPCR